MTAIIAGRFSERVPARWLIGPGLLLVGVGLILMGGLSGDSTWTHLIPGFIVAGLGAGLVNPPLASTAIGVVPPEKAGMASGVNSTFRQVGIAAGIAALGSIFTAGDGAPPGTGASDGDVPRRASSPWSGRARPASCWPACPRPAAARWPQPSGRASRPASTT